MSKRKKYKVGDRIFFECYDGTINTAIVQKVIPDTYIDDDNKPYYFNTLETGEDTCIEDYNTLPYSDPRVKALQKQLHKQDVLIGELRDWIINKCETYPNYYNNETIAAALWQVAKEYGYKED